MRGGTISSKSADEMKINRYVFGAWSGEFRKFRKNLSVYDLREVGPLKAEKVLEDNGEERVCVYSGGNFLFIEFYISCWTLATKAGELKGEEYFLTRKSFKDFLKSLENKLVVSNDGYPARLRYKKTVEL
jgi:hypothetical protein